MSLSQELKQISRDHLKRMASLVDTLDVTDDALFQDFLIVALNRCGVERKRVCAQLKISKSAVSKWISGKSMPHVIIRRAVAGFIKVELMTLADGI